MSRKAKELKFRRRREALTNYAKRLALVKSGLERIVIRESNRRILSQIVAYEETGDRVRASADSGELAKLGWPSRCNRPTAYLTGMLLAKKAKEQKKEYVLDIGLSAPVKNSIPFVFAKGCIDGGLHVKGSLEMGAEAYDGSQISKYAEALKKDESKYSKQFGSYLKAGIKPEQLQKLFSEAREKISKM